MQPKKPGKPCARCERTWREHKDRAEGTCRKWRGEWTYGRRKPVPGSLERALNAMDEEK